MRQADYAAFVAALCDADAAVPEFASAPDTAALADRFAVYRNNVHVSLVASLADSFPIVRAMVGEEFFHAMARSFVQQHKPMTALLRLYGTDFPDFIAAFEPAASLPWMPDVARLELAWSESWAAADASALPIGALQGFTAGDLARARVKSHPAARLVRSPWPIANLWEAHQHPEPNLATLSWQPQRVLITRPGGEVLLMQLEDPAADFTAALMAGESIEHAASRVPQLDTGALLVRLFDHGLILEICR